MFVDIFVFFCLGIKKSKGCGVIGREIYVEKEVRIGSSRKIIRVWIYDCKSVSKRKGFY